MKIEQRKFTVEKGWQNLNSKNFDSNKCNLVIVFGSTSLLSDASLFSTLRNFYPKAEILINSTAGEIENVNVTDDSIVVTAICFEATEIKSAHVQIKQEKNSFEAGVNLASQFDPVGLSNLLIISDGQLVNGSDLVAGIQRQLDPKVIISGGLAGDGSRFQLTLVGLNEIPLEGRIAAIGFYGKRIQVSCGSVGGWDSFGPERIITKSKGNILYELDHQPALDIYKKYLGEYAESLPSSGLLFPISIRANNNDDSLVRTILNVNEVDKSLTFAGNMPEGSFARLMKANFDRLIDGASNAASSSLSSTENMPDLAILISCVGRKLILNQRIEEEVEAVRNVFGDKTIITGFYSYGEISSSLNFNKCELHNQTMTITTFKEVV